VELPGILGLRKSFGHDVFESPMLPTILDVVEPPHSPSPDMRPQKDLPNFIQIHLVHDLSLVLAVVIDAAG
jgi:hypothetical protein